MAYTDHEKKKAWNKAWCEANKDRIAAVKRAWRDANKDKVNATKRAWYASNKERIDAAKRSWYARSTEQQRATRRAWRTANKDKVNAAGRAAYAKDPTRCMDNYLRRHYGVTIDMHAARGVVCENCGLPETVSHRKDGTADRLCVDHCHLTNLNRGVVCQRCNLHQFGEDLDLEQKWIDYKRRWRSIHAAVLADPNHPLRDWCLGTARKKARAA